MLKPVRLLVCLFALSTLVGEVASAKALPNTDQEKAAFINQSRGLHFAQGVSDKELISLRANLVQAVKNSTGEYTFKQRRGSLLLLKQVPSLFTVIKLLKIYEGKTNLNQREALSLFKPLQSICTQLQKRPAATLTEIENLSVCLYSMDGYEPLAVALSANDAQKIQNLRGMIRSLDGALAKLPPYRGVVTHRQTLSNGQLARLQKGYRFRVPTYLSSAKESVSNTFPGNVEFIISSRSGRDIQGLSANSEEGEVLFPRGSKFEVIDRPETSGNTTKIYLKEVGGN
ncbi:MAG: hypothetical protein EOP05_10025 [Proteobacteria bacterium]|nr:MAG: hypothetical protein EOP05_10025 [Pseudomonadota bacterium]